MSALGFQHSVFVDASGKVWSAGRGVQGRLGLGHRESVSVIQEIKDLPPCSMVAVGFHFTACVTFEGSVFTFGHNHNGQLGQGHTEDLDTPHLVVGLPPIRSVACGDDFVLCVGYDSSLWAWGSNSYGKLGIGSKEKRVLSPVLVPHIQAQQIACGVDHALILTPEGQVYGVGHGSLGELGSAGTCCKPTLLSVPCSVETVHCGAQFSLLRDSDGVLWNVGNNGKGALGRPKVVGRNQFTAMPDIKARIVACRNAHVLVIDEQDRLWGWGANEFGQLGDMEIDPTKPLLLRSEAMRDALAGYYNSVVVTMDNEVLVCGYNQHGQLSLSSISNSVPWTSNPHFPPDMVRSQGSKCRSKSARSSQPE